MTRKMTTWKGCGSKRRYRDENLVRKVMKLREKESGIKLDYYYCQNCNGYHLTSKNVGSRWKHEDS